MGYSPWGRKESDTTERLELSHSWWWWFSAKSYTTLATPWTVAHQAPLFMGFSRQEYWNGVPFPSPGDLPRSGIELAFPEWAGGFFTTEPPGRPCSINENVS